MRVIISDHAEADLDEIVESIKRQNPAAAARVLDQLQQACLGLGGMPFSFGLVPRYEERGVRRRIVSNYLVFFRVHADRVEVLHVLHGARDYGRSLFPDDID